MPATVVGPTVDGSGGSLIAAVWAWHSQQQGVGINNPAYISGSGGSGFRQFSVAFDQNTYRDVGVPVFGTKTIASTGYSQIFEWTGAAVAPSSGALTDSNTCTGPGISGLGVGLPVGATISAGFDSATQQAEVATGGSLNFTRNYSTTFQCRVSSAVPAQNTRWSGAEMVWKSRSIRNETTRSSFFW